uniref:Uncharacterized protein n=1 Tax=Acrobeloides nanus TaxID=290746 RepID=A0A914DAY6_9BILA
MNLSRWWWNYNTECKHLRQRIPRTESRRTKSRKDKVQGIMKDGTGDRQSNLEVIQIVARIKQRLQVVGENAAEDGRIDMEVIRIVERMKERLQMDPDQATY